MLHNGSKVISLKQPKAHVMEKGLGFYPTHFSIYIWLEMVPDEMMSHLRPCGRKNMGQCVRCDIVFLRLAYALWISIRSFSSCHHARTSGSQATFCFLGLSWESICLLRVFIGLGRHDRS